MEPRHPPGPLLAATTSNAGQIAIAFFDSDPVTSEAYTRRYDGTLMARRPDGRNRLISNRTGVRARPTGFERADAINIRIPVDGACIRPFAEGA